MEEMKIESKFTTTIVSKLLEHIIKNKLGHAAKIDLKSLQYSLLGDAVYAHLDIDVSIAQKDVTSLLGKIGVK